MHELYHQPRTNHDRPSIFSVSMIDVRNEFRNKKEKNKKIGNVRVTLFFFTFRLETFLVEKKRNEEKPKKKGFH